MPWTGQVGAFFGRVDRYDQHGFYGPCETDRGRPLPAPLQPPDLIIQDELHLISGPLGTMVGLYETRPRRAVQPGHRRQEGPAQDHRLDRHGPPCREPDPGPVRPPAKSRSSRRRVPTAATRSSPRPIRPAESHPRLYLGIAAQGRSLKVVMLRTYLALLGAARRPTTPTAARRTTTTPPTRT